MNIWHAAPLAAGLIIAAPAFAQDHGAHHDHGPAPHEAPAPMAQHEGMQSGLFGGYAMGRDASGTSWQPDLSSHGGVHAMRGDWALMGHLHLNAVYDWQDGPRGDEKTFLAGMAMGSARRDFSNGDTLNLRVMASPDPFMGKSGYPLQFAAGETADGENLLVDRQHPHDLLMELSASYAHRLGAESSVFVYAGLPGEPAFGPPAFMHRLSAGDSPEAPISHHWLDSTHITYGVLTAGLVRDDWKIEASRFRGREPDQDRYDIETGDLDSTAVRVSWNPGERWALQASWADVISPEALEPDEDENRWSASAIYARPLGAGLWSTTLAFARKQHDGGDPHDAWLLETALAPNDQWTIFARGERIETEELAPGGDETVARLSLGAIRDVRVSSYAKIGIGALLQSHRAPRDLEPLYGGDPAGAMAFVRLKIG